MKAADVPLSQVEQARKIALRIGGKSQGDTETQQLCCAITCLADALKAMLTKKEAK